jgi:hypothetical protein
MTEPADCQLGDEETREQRFLHKLALVAAVVAVIVIYLLVREFFSSIMTDQHTVVDGIKSYVG